MSSKFWDKVTKDEMEGKMYLGNWGGNESIPTTTIDAGLNLYAIRIILGLESEVVLTKEHIESVCLNYVKDGIGVLEIRLKKVAK